MEDLVPLVALLCVFGSPVAIIWMVMHFRERRRVQDGMKPGGAVSAELEALAEKMEHRIDALEQILDAEAPGWRKRHHEH